MHGDLIELIVVGVIFFLSWVGKQIQQQGKSTPTGRPPRAPRKSGLDALVELEKRLREAQRAAEGGTAPGEPRAQRQAGAPAASRHPSPAARPPAAPRTSRQSTPAVIPTATALESSAERPIPTVDSAEPGEAFASSSAATSLDGDSPTRPSGRSALPGATGRSTLQTALVWSEVLGPPLALR